MTMYSLQVQGLPMRLRTMRSIFLGCVLAVSAGCEVEWGGATVQLEDPSPPPEEVPADESEAERVELPLPDGPLLWVLRSSGTRGEALAMPVARLQDGAPSALDFPEPPPEGYRERFDAAFAASGVEMVLGSAGYRIGSLVLEGPPRVVDASCPSVVPARALLIPGTALPRIAFALGPDVSVDRPDSPRFVQVDNRMRTFGPILAEQLLRRGGEDRPFLAQRAELRAIPWRGDESAAMVATYLINDAVEGPGPAGSATSLFFLARFGPSGYVVDWSEMRTYSGDSGGREIFTWLGAAPLPGGRLDVAVRRDGTTRRLVASVDSEDADRGIGWTEGARCAALELLEVADAELAAPAME